ncbi:MAG: FAD-dependent monooxygenase [Candidatus Omnitrophica bacterium]|nr:FAD-dependent monooxygenase [Candidatus Omnitrophota bacterium]
MGYKEIALKLPTDYTEEQLRFEIEKKINLKEFSYQIKRKSLDARNKHSIHWQMQVGVSSKHLKKNTLVKLPILHIPYRKRKEKVVVVGSGPAGFFSAYVLQKAGFNTTIIERGSEVDKRAEDIRAFEKTGIFNSASNYAFGEGGAGTFSDGKLTSRSKHILKEKGFIISNYIESGAPEEIRYMAYPHLGSENLNMLVKNLREKFLNLGGIFLFETFVNDLKIKNEIVTEVITDKGEIETDIVIIASGNSAYDTYRMLIKKGVIFRTKNFAIGSRVEHPQEIINTAQWGWKNVPGVKAAEYRLTSKGDGEFSVYTFCMCPGGTVVPAAAYANTNIVNGMSYYKRDGKFANAACVAGINLDKINGRLTLPEEALDWLENLEQSFYEYSGSYEIPYCGIKNFIRGKGSLSGVESSYPLGIKSAPLWDLLPLEVSSSLKEGLKDFCGKIKGFDSGIIMGLDSKSSSPIQVLRGNNMLCDCFDNLYIAGEGSGYSGGIMSSGADGIKIAFAIIEKF